MLMGVCSAGFSTTQLPAASAGASFQQRHQDREVPGNDLADDAQRLVEVIGDRVVIDLGDRAFLGAQAAGEVTEVVDGERNVGGHRLADRLAVVERLDHRDQLEIALHAIGDLEQHAGAHGRRGVAPLGTHLVRRIKREFDVFGRRPGDFAERLAGDGRQVGEVLALDGSDPLAADKVVIARANADLLRELV